MLARSFEEGFGRSRENVATKKIPDIQIKNILKVLQKKSPEQLQEIPDVGPKVAQSIFDWFRDARNAELLGRIEAGGV